MTSPGDVGFKGLPPTVSVVPGKKTQKQTLEERARTLLVGRMIEYVTVRDDTILIHLYGGGEFKMSYQPGSLQEDGTV